MLGIGVAFDLGPDDTGALGGAVPALGALWGRTVELHELGVIHIGTERALDRLPL